MWISAGVPECPLWQPSSEYLSLILEFTIELIYVLYSQFRELPNTNQDWLELLRQQELSHESELRKWHQVLQTAIELLKKVSIVCEKIYNDGQLRQSIESMHMEL